MVTRTKDTDVIYIQLPDSGRIRFYVVGTAPYLCNAMAQKAKCELLYPRRRATGAERSLALKHNPIREYRESCYLVKRAEFGTAIAIKMAAFKQAMASAAIDIPGASKAQIARMLWVEGHMGPMYGVPQMSTWIVRSSDIARTPDVRTRAIIPEWASTFDVEFSKPRLNESTVANLLAHAGQRIGVGDGRPEKGKLDFGRFYVLSKPDDTWLRIVEHGGRRQQMEALDNWTYFDDETEELIEWFLAEARKRGADIRDRDFEAALEEVAEAYEQGFADNGR